jgi:hypothetical protein
MFLSYLILEKAIRRIYHHLVRNFKNGFTMENSKKLSVENVFHHEALERLFKKGLCILRNQFGKN